MLDMDAITVPGGAAAGVLAATDPAALSDGELIEFTRAAERQVAHANAVCLAAVRVLAARAATAGTALARRVQRPGAQDAGSGQQRAAQAEARCSALGERAGVLEVSQTLRISQYSAARRVHLAGLLGERLAPAATALRAGQVGLGHVWVLAEHAEQVDDERLLAALQAACLPRAGQQTPGNFGRSLTRALHALDPHGQAVRHRAARGRAGVRRGQEHEGMASLAITATDPEVEWGYTVLDTLARGRLHQLKTTTPTEQPHPARACGRNGNESTPSADEGLRRAGASQIADACGRNGVEPTPPEGDGAAADDVTGEGCGRNGIDPTPGVADRLRPTADAPQIAGACGQNGIESTPSAGDGGAVADETSGGARGRNGNESTPSAGGDGAVADAGGGGACGRNGVGPTPLPTLDQLRSQVFFDLLQRAVSDPSFPTQHGKRRIETQIVIDLETLLGLREHPATINGRSVPAPIARELAAHSGTLRRLVTDPVIGHLLDYGHRRDAPADLTEFLLARDGTCRIPHCNVRASACDLDHSIPHEHGGPSSAANEGALCRSHHPPKTHGLIDIIDSAADGSAVLITALGQRIPIPPRPVLPEPRAPLPTDNDTSQHDPGTNPTAQNADEPPF